MILGWIILGFLALLVSAIPPYFTAKYSYHHLTYWDAFKEFNLAVWGFLLTIGLICGLLISGLTLIGVLNW